MEEPEVVRIIAAKWSQFQTRNSVLSSHFRWHSCTKFALKTDTNEIIPPNDQMPLESLMIRRMRRPLEAVIK